MNFQLYFCADGILRAKFSDDKPMIPVKFIYDNSDFAENDFKFWTRWWKYNVYFEEGLTVGKFLSCLEPWAEFWGDITGKDVREYIKEACHPVIIKKSTSDKLSLDWVGLFYYNKIEAEIEYFDEDDNFFEKDINEWINKPQNARLTGKWNIYSGYNLSGFINGKKEEYCIDHTPMNKLYNIPFILSDKQILYFNNLQFVNDNFNIKTDHVLDKNAFGVCEINNIRFVVGKKYHTMRNVIEGFFFGMHQTPSHRQDFLRQLKNINDEIKQTEKDLNKNDRNTEITNNKKSIKINITPNAFNPIITKIERDAEYWEHMLKLARYDNVVLRIGKINLAKEPENRFLNYIIDHNDKLANPQPSDYKLI